MLALQASMDSLRTAHAFTSDSPDLLRQPSAEDLDAAHQLVSSARGRNGDYGGHERRPSTLSNGQAPRIDTEIGDDAARQQEQTRNSTGEEDAVNLNQICRYAMHQPCLASLVYSPPCRHHHGLNIHVQCLEASTNTLQQLWNDKNPTLA